MGWLAIIVIQAFTVGGVWVKLNNAVENSASKGEVRRVDDRVQAMASSVGVIPNLQLQVAQVMSANAENKARIEEIGARLDKFMETIGNKLDNINENVHGVKIDIRVLSQKVDSQNGLTTKPAVYFPRASIK